MGLVDGVTSRTGVRASSLVGTAIITTLTYLLIRYAKSKRENPAESDAGITENPIITDGSVFKTYTTDVTTYPSIRSFYHAHKHTKKLQAIADLPLLVFIHGLGGSLEQFGPLLGSLINTASCFGIELPGHGQSAFESKDSAAYSVDASAALWREAISDICQEHGHTKLVLIGHSMGCSISALLATGIKPKFDVVGMVSICPKSTPPTETQGRQFRRLLSLPDFILDIFRFFDRRGGIDSKSVKRFVGPDADVNLRRAQLYYNEQFKTPVWKHFGLGCIASYDADGEPHGGIPGISVWSQVDVPLFLVAGEADTVTKPEEVDKIVSVLQHRKPHSHHDGYLSRTQTKSEPIPASAEVPDQQAPDQPGSAPTQSQPTQPSPPPTSDKTFSLSPTIAHKKSHHSQPIKTAILPSPASHALLYSPHTHRTLAGLIEDFLSLYISSHLSLSWQLQCLTTSGKWDVKNLEKWQSTLPVSAPINTRAPHSPNGLFRALKTLREQDEHHTPLVFLKEWKDKIFAVIDISKDAPIYDTQALNRGGIQYHKFPTVSKIPPKPVEVADFITLVDRIRADILTQQQNQKAIAVHCHYGYNRTGFFLCSYLIETEGYGVEEAIQEFKRAKPPGIKHEHFVDTLFVRYCVGLRRMSTFSVDDLEDSEE